MARGKNENASRIYMKVGYGKFRQMRDDSGNKVDENTPGATKRESDKGTTWSIEYDFINGKIESVFLKEGGTYEGRKFPNTIEVVVNDGMETIQASLNSEDYNFCYLFLEMLPNIDLSKEVKINVYDYMGRDKDGNKKKKSGLTIEQEGNPNSRELKYKDGTVVHLINSFYKTYENEKWIYKNGFPSSEGKDLKNEGYRKMYNIEVRMFLLNELKSKFADKFKRPEALSSEGIDEVIAEHNSEVGDNPDDLPF
jgi:hypothetical protein